MKINPKFCYEISLSFLRNPKLCPKFVKICQNKEVFYSKNYFLYLLILRHLFVYLDRHSAESGIE